MDRRSDGVILAVANIAASSSLNVPAFHCFQAEGFRPKLTLNVVTSCEALDCFVALGLE